MNLVVVGTLAFDSVETPFGKRDDILGGSATFLGTCASYFTPVQMVGIVGNDFPQEHFDFFESRKIDTAGVDRVDGRTFRWKAGQRSSRTMDKGKRTSPPFKNLLICPDRASIFLCE